MARPAGVVVSRATSIAVCAACVAIALLAGCRREAERGPLRLAVAANLGLACADLIAAFATQHGGIDVAPSYGATGALATQVAQGAPFDLLLAADQQRPHWLESEGHAVAGTRFTYARGRLVLVGSKLDDPADGSAALRRPDVARLAIANPDTAPYGAAAMAVLERLGLAATYRDRLLRGQSVAQTQEFVDAGGADLGFVALAQVITRPGVRYWLVPEDLHPPIRQDVVLLREGPAARAFWEFLKTAPARAVFVRHGYVAEG